MELERPIEQGYYNSFKGEEVDAEVIIVEDTKQLEEGTAALPPPPNPWASKTVSRLMLPMMMDSKVFEKIFDAWNLATVTSTVWGPDSDMAKKAQSAFYSILNSVDDDTKLEFLNT